MKKFVLAAGCCLALIFFTAACGRNAPQPEPAPAKTSQSSYYPVQVENFKSNRERTVLTFNDKPKRVIANQQNTIETLLALEQDNAIIAASCTSGHTTEFLNKYRERADNLPTIDRYNFDLETVLMLRPDFIVGWQSTFSERALRSTDFWRERGVNAYIVENSNSILPKGTVEDEYRFLQNMGTIFNKQQLAGEMVNAIKAEIEDSVRRTAGLPKQKTLILEFMGNTISVYGANRLGGDMVQKLGGELLDCGSRIGAEDLLELNPDVIFVVCIGWEEDAEACVNRVMKNQAFRSLRAVKNKRVYAIPLMYMYASSTRTLDGIKVFKEGLYPWLKGKDNAVRQKI